MRYLHLYERGNGVIEINVKELIEQLKLLPEDLPVIVSNETYPEEAETAIQDYYWVKNTNKMIRVYANKQKCVAIR